MILNNWIMPESALGCAWLVAMVIINVMLALGVWFDARMLVEGENRGCVLLGPGLWAFTTLMLGLLAATAYWLINRSTLRRD